MPDKNKAFHRAEGVLDNLRSEMERKLEQEGRSDEYKEAFWFALDNLMRTGV